MPVIGGNAIDHGFAYAGMVVDNQVENSVSKVNLDATNIPAGYAVVSSGDDGAVVGDNTATAKQFIGIVKREMNRDVFAELSDEANNVGRDMTIVTHGVVYAQALAAVTKDDDVYFVIGDGTTPNANLGRFTNAVGAGVTAALQVAGAKWTSSAGAGALAKISFGLGG